MRYRLILQMGADSESDLFDLRSNPEYLLDKTLQTIQFDLRIKRILKIQDGTPHLIEWESVIDKNNL